MTISLIACLDMDRNIGSNNQLLTHLPNDLRRFKQLTTDKTIVMGRKTYESLNSKPLPNRTNLIISSDIDYPVHEDAYLYNSVDDVLNEYYMYANKEDELMVCGGQTIYEQFLPFADTLYLTIIHHTFDNGDTKFPEFDLSEFTVTENVYNSPDDKHAYPYSYVTYKRKNIQ